MAEKALWRMPAWMERYRYMIGQTDGDVDELMIWLLERPGGRAEEPDVYLRAVAVRAQINLLYELEAAGALKGANPDES